MPRPSPRRVVVALLVSLAACGGDGKSLGQNAACKSSGDCAIGLICDGGQCRTACNVDQDCPVGNHCAYGLCVPLPKGVCAQAGDCISPPDACHIIAGATCDNSRCTYPHKNDPTCGAPCASDNDCDPLAHGLDRCSSGACSNHVCSFTPVSNCPYEPLATQCAHDNDCASAHCADGVCCDTACDGVCSQCAVDSGHCQKPDDDSSCGIIDCDGLDNMCRNYQDLSGATHHRCADVGKCAEDNNAADCVVFVNGSDSTICRDSASACDIPESCSSGVCPNDVMVSVGGQCIGNTGDDDPGVCDSTQRCLQLTTLGSGNRYFLEESSTTGDRVDAYGSHNLTASSHDDVTVESESTGRGLQWGATSALTTYCVDGNSTPIDTIAKTATLEVDITPSLGTYTDAWIAGISGDNENVFGLSMSHMSGDSTATVHVWVNDNSVSYTIDPSPSRIVMHVLFDSLQSTGGGRLKLFVNGTATSGTGTYPLMNSSISGSLGNYCVGNTVTNGDAAFTGTVWYSALYSGVPSSAQIHNAVSRLTVSDAP